MLVGSSTLQMLIVYSLMGSDAIAGLKSTTCSSSLFFPKRISLGGSEIGNLEFGVEFDEF